MARKSNIVSVNMKGVEGKRKLPDAGEYSPATIAEAELIKQKGKDGYIKWTVDLPDDQGRVWYNTSLGKTSLWNLRGWLEALGVDVPDDEMDIDLSEMTDLEIGVVIEHETYEDDNGNKKPTARIVDYFSVDDAKESKKGKKKKDKDDDGEDDKKGGKKKKKGKDKLSKSDVSEMDREDLLKLNEEHDLELDEDDYDDNKKGNKKLLADVLEKLDENELLEGDEESDDGEEKLSREKVEAMDEDELADLIKEHKLGKKVDLDDYKTLGKKTKAVISALEDADLLED